MSIPNTNGPKNVLVVDIAHTGALREALHTEPVVRDQILSTNASMPCLFLSRYDLSHPNRIVRLRLLGLPLES